MEVLRHDGRGYLLLERRTAGADGLTIDVYKRQEPAWRWGAVPEQQAAGVTWPAKQLKK